MVKKVLVALFIVFFTACAVESGNSFTYSEPEYTGEDGELGGRCILPERVCNCYPECFCDSWDLRCILKSKQSLENEIDDEIDDDDNSLSDGWGK